MDRKKLKEKLIELGEPKFRLKQILKAVYEDGVLDFSQILVLPKSLREKLSREMEILPFFARNVLVSKDKKSIKALLETKDGNLIETVLLNPKVSNWSACVSSQAGCSLGCAFCATGQGGFKRNLTAEEIEGQILFWKNYLKKNNLAGNLDNIVYMGMGEPFLNFEEVAKSLEDLTDSELFGFGSRSISVSTAGVMDKWMEFAGRFPQINLAISLHSADKEKRAKIMPISQKFDLDSIRETLKGYLAEHKRKVFVEYILLSGFNDSARDARQLSEFLKSIGKSYLLHVNLIRYNFTPTPKGTVISNNEKNVIINNKKKAGIEEELVWGQAGNDWRPSSQETAEKFLKVLEENRIQATIRQSLGGDIQGACGQLAGKV